MAKELTRRELYDLVWSRPMTKVAADLGISDVALHKICAKHRVPAPGRGHWAKVAASKPVKVVIFRELTDPLIDRIRIEGGPTSFLPAEVLEARNRAKAEAAARRAAEKQASVPVVENELHPYVSRLQSKLENRKTSDNGFISVNANNLFQVSVAPDSVTRLVAFLDRFTKYAESAGYQFKPGERSLDLFVQDERITLAIAEQNDKVRHEPTDKEMNALRKWEAERERKIKLKQWYSDWDKPKIPEWDVVPSGRLTLEMDKGHHWDGLRRNFSDGQRQRLENMLDSILAAAATLSAQKKSKRAQDEQQKRERAEAEQRRKESERRAHLETQRRDFLEVQMDYLARSERVEAFVLAYRQMHCQTSIPSSCEQWLHWASAYAARIRNHIRPERLAEILDKHDLMNDQAEVRAWIDMKREAL